ncbi:hypothetical protein RHSIM_Rhsim06G0168400 [Rhododendron simsii]|nr:hypothetical protein RHSIM_Rhsim06G0168400 [Rhododendron simsii]
MMKSGQKRPNYFGFGQKNYAKRLKGYSNRGYVSNRRTLTRRYRGVNTSNKRYFMCKSLKDEVFCAVAGVRNGMIYSDYFTLPSLGQGVETRNTNRVKIWTVNLDGRFSVCHIGQPDHQMVEDPSQSVDIPNIEGNIGLFVVLDRMPVPSAIPTFGDVFGEVPNDVSSILDQHVRVDQLSRFKVLVRERRYVNESLHGSTINLKRYVKLSGRNRVVTTFKDMGTNTSGRYGNIRDNALVIYAV